MKERMTKWLLVMVIFLMTLTACGNTPDSDKQGAGIKNSQTQEVDDDFHSHNPAVVREESAILDSAELLEGGQIYYVPNERVESALQQEIALFDGNILMWGYGENTKGVVGFHISLLSLQTGKVLQEKTFEGMELPSAQICGDKIAVIDSGLGKVFLLDCTFEVLDEYETDTSYCSIYMDDEARNIYCFTQEGVKMIDTDTKKVSMLLEDAMMLFASTKCGTAVSVTYTHPTTQLNQSAVVDLKTGEVETLPFEGAFYGEEYSEGIWLAAAIGDENVFYLGKSDRPKAFVPQGNHTQVTMISNPLRLMTTTYDDYGQITLGLYSLDGKFLSQANFSADIASVLYEPVWSEADGGYFLTAIDQNGKDKLLFWDMKIPTIGEDLVLQPAYEESAETSEVAKELLDRAAAIGKEYGIGILMGDQTEDSYDIYNMAHEMDGSYIADGLDALESALEKYPKGFMKQLLYGDQKKLEFHLTGAFTLKEYPEGEVNGFTSYIGLAHEASGKNVIVVDITMAGSIEQTLHHEIMHMIDKRLRVDAILRDGALYSDERWMELNPNTFSYVEDKFHIPEEVYYDGYESYFIDIYSRTTANEDRARIMEYAMIDADWAFANAEGRYKKLKYLSDCIRDAFDTTGWPEKTVWEKTLDRCK